MVSRSAVSKLDVDADGKPFGTLEDDRDNYSLSKIEDFREMSTYDKVLELTRTCLMEFRKNPLLIILMIGASITRLISVLFSTYLLLWIQSFVIDPTNKGQ